MSPARPRTRRVPPERTGPVRNPAAASRPAPGIDALLDATVGEGLRTAERLAAASGAVVQGAVECGVRTAYTVIDEYVKRGREAARREERPVGRDTMSDEQRNYGNWSAAWGPMWPLAAPWLQAMQAWANAMSAFAPGMAPPNVWGPFPGGGPWGPTPSPPGASTPPRVSVQLSSDAPTKVSVR